MTREEMKLLYAKDALRSGHIDIMFDKIDDFESRTCENCKYLDRHCYNMQSVAFNQIPEKTDGCNKWESK